MKNTIIRVSAVAAVTLLASLSARADGDAEAGKKVFNKCKACHTATEEKNKVGPHLVGVIGRTAGTLEGFKYSKSMVEAGEGGLVWDEEKLTEYLHKPKDMIKKTKMAFPGLKDDEDIANVIAYLKADPKP